MAAIVAAGWALGRYQFLGAGAERVLARRRVHRRRALPADGHHRAGEGDEILTRGALVTVTSTAAIAVLAAVVLRKVWRQDAPEATIGTLSATYVNAGNLGSPGSVPAGQRRRGRPHPSCSSC